MPLDGIDAMERAEDDADLAAIVFAVVSRSRKQDEVVRTLVRMAGEDAASPLREYLTVPVEEAAMKQWRRETDDLMRGLGFTSVPSPDA